MALSFKDEIEGFLQHGLEQSPTFQQAVSQGRAHVGGQESLEFLATMIANQGKAIIRIAQEIDDLRSAIAMGK